MANVTRMCPACREFELRWEFAIDGVGVGRCPHCGHVALDVPIERDHVARVYGDAYFHGGDGGYPNYESERALLSARGLRYARILGRYRKPSNLLDIGCAAGYTTAAFARAGWHATGLEPNESMARIARRNDRIDVRCDTLEAFGSETLERFDVVAMIQVAGHFVDPENAFRRADRLTAPGGLWLIETWNPTSLTARLCGRGWHEYNPPSVLQIYSPTSLRTIVGRIGYRQVARGRPAKSLLAPHAKALLESHASANRLVAVAAKLAHFVPDSLTLPYPFDDVYYGIFERLT